MEEGANMGGYHLTTADNMIRLVYGDHLPPNNGTHLDGCVADKMVGQCGRASETYQ